jgi:hypothetical protein
LALSHYTSNLWIFPFAENRDCFTRQIRAGEQGRSDTCTSGAATGLRRCGAVAQEGGDRGRKKDDPRHLSFVGLSHGGLQCLVDNVSDGVNN